MMWLLTLRGPEFLLVYIAVAAWAYGGAYWISLKMESEPRDRTPVRDPYVIAYLRGGLGELIRVVVLSLTLRGLVNFEERGIQTTDPEEIERARVPVEKVMLVV